MWCGVNICILFFKQKTAYEMRISDWSSDVCSSDLASPFTLYPLYFYFLVLGIVAVVILVNQRLEHSHLGRAWEAIREDEVAAQAMGVPLVRMKLLALARKSGV